MSQRFCMHCGGELGPNDKFCFQCGTPVNAAGPGAGKTTRKSSDDTAQINTDQVRRNKGANKKPVRRDDRYYTDDRYEDDRYDDRGSNSGKQPKKQKKSGGGKVALIIILVLILAAGLGVGGYFVANSIMSSDTEEETEESEYRSNRDKDKEDEDDDDKDSDSSKSSSHSRSSESSDTATANSDYILPNSATAYISESDLTSLSEWEVKVARNEIYARHGLMFKTTELQEYFNGKSWYTGTIAAGTDISAQLNEYEKANVETITSYETAHHLNGK